jgi:hypothetical protein
MHDKGKSQMQAFALFLSARNVAICVFKVNGMIGRIIE